MDVDDLGEARLIVRAVAQRVAHEPQRKLDGRLEEGQLGSLHDLASRRARSRRSDARVEDGVFGEEGVERCDEDLERVVQDVLLAQHALCTGGRARVVNGRCERREGRHREA